MTHLNGCNKKLLYSLIVLLPIFGSIVSGFFGRFIGYKGAAVLTTVAMFITTIFSYIALYELLLGGNPIYINIMPWLDTGMFEASWSFMFDSLTIIMLIVVTTVSVLVHLYSIEYMSQDPHLPRFMSYLSFFTFCMLMLVTADNFIQLFFGWEGVGVSSYLLINFWFTRVAANKAAIKAIIVNRIGDFGLSLGFLVIYLVFQSIDYSTIFALLPYYNPQQVDNVFMDGGLVKTLNLFYNPACKLSNVDIDNIIKKNVHTSQNDILVNNSLVYNIQGSSYILRNFFEILLEKNNILMDESFNKFKTLYNILYDIHNGADRSFSEFVNTYTDFHHQSSEFYNILASNDIHKSFNIFICTTDNDSFSRSYQFYENIFTSMENTSKEVFNKFSNNSNKIIDKIFLLYNIDSHTYYTDSNNIVIFSSEEPFFNKFAQNYNFFFAQNLENYKTVFNFSNLASSEIIENEKKYIKFQEAYLQQFYKKTDGINNKFINEITNTFFEIKKQITQTNPIDYIFSNYILFFWSFSIHHFYDIICIFLFIGAVGKSAQIGLHTWLPDAMEGPTPVSALIHAATMVTAGVFLLLRCSILFEQAPNILLIITIIGAITALFAATAGLLQNDLKKVIAYSTCSQLGYMVFACGMSNYTVSIFHLMNHAFFKALLFLSAGSVIHAMADEQDMRKMGGLVNILPFTYSMIIIGSLSLMGFPFLTGFYSKDVILELAFAKYTIASSFAYWLGTLAAFFTAFYSFRLIYLTFLTESNSYKKIMENAHDAPIKMAIPLSLLMFGSIFVGFLTKDLIIGVGSDFWGTSIFSKPENLTIIDSEFLPYTIKLLPVGISIIGALTAFILNNFYAFTLANFKLTSLGAKMYGFINRKWFFDTVYNEFIVKVSLLFGYHISFKLIDRGILEILGPFGLTKAGKYFAHFLSTLQTGNVYNYASLMLIGAILFLIIITAGFILNLFIQQSTYIEFTFFLVIYCIIHKNIMNQKELNLYIL